MTGFHSTPLVSSISVLALAATLLVLGCGDDEGGTDSMATAPTTASGTMTSTMGTDSDGSGSSGTTDDTSDTTDTTGAVGCAPSAEPTTDLRHDTDIQPIWDANCQNEVGCHDGGAFVPDLSAGSAYDEIVCAKSLPTDLNYIEPGSAATSYMMVKMLDTQGTLDGCDSDPPPCGVIMPSSFDVVGNPPIPISAADLATIEEWIDGGAPQ